MRAVVQRVKSANVKVENEIVGKIDKGLLLFLGISKEDEDKDFDYIYNKVLKLRIFEDKNNVMNLSINDIKGELLVISQFTLYGDGRKGNRPSYVRAANHEKAIHYYEKFINAAKDDGIHTESGVFAADMDVNLVNDGPVTILLDSEKVF